MRRKMKKKLPIPTKYLVLILTAICIIFIFVSFTANISGGPLKTVAGYVFVPMQKGINKVGTAISDKIEYIQELNQVMEENEELTAQVNELTEELNSLKLDQYELDNLKELLEVSEEYSDYDTMTATVIGKDAGNWFSTFLIDKGSKDGITVDMNVIAGGGLVGIVTDVGQNYAKVRSIIDDTNNVSAMVVNTSDNCIVSGDLEEMNANQQILISDLQDDEDAVKEGDQIVTSNVSDKYLPNLRIGYISTLEYDSNNLTKSGTITPSVDFKHMNNVLVILQTKEYVDEEE
ncbi:rod shape-determining protein MreC [Eubacterium oxidoreducens]|uniref:Cell shape-determining protein MreC n=1 Tax=Eubacterium oxidoreducens TaxID=1732 RepID=A0A1G6ALG6_EUBOX|nr:rod shape-determining protein MreC [Eubacterium oxidoreducens]SDB09221.1 rod shape-determining protein MreC [Eubacterium oxidoreducens]